MQSFGHLSNYSEMYLGAKPSAALGIVLILTFPTLGEKFCNLIKCKIKCQSQVLILLFKLLKEPLNGFPLGSTIASPHATSAHSPVFPRFHLFSKHTTAFTPVCNWSSKVALEIKHTCKYLDCDYKMLDTGSFTNSTL